MSVDGVVALARRLAVTLNVAAFAAAGIGVAATAALPAAAGAAAAAIIAILAQLRRGGDGRDLTDALVAACLCSLAISGPAAELALPALVAATVVAALERAATHALAWSAVFGTAYLIGLVPELANDSAAHAFATLLPLAVLPAAAFGVTSVRDRIVADASALGVERHLRTATLGLASARDAQSVYRVLFEGVDAVARPAASATAVVRSEQVVASNVPFLAGRRADMTSPLVTAAATSAAPSHLVGAEARAVARELGLPDGTETALVIPLLTPSGAASGSFVVVTADQRLPDTTVSALQLLVDTTSAVLRTSTCTDAMSASDSRLAAMVRDSYDVIAAANLDGTLTFVSTSVESMLGRSPSELVGTPLDAMTRPEDAERVRAFLALAVDEGGASSGRIRLAHADGTWRYCEGRGQRLDHGCDASCPVHGGRPEVVINIRDVTDRVTLEEDLAHRAFHDALTNLPNRALLTNRVEQALRSARRTGARVGVLFCDLDDFKTVNDTLGHQVGDQLLMEVSRRLSECIRPSDTGARMGGDEFAILLEELTDTEEAEQVARRLLAHLDPAFSFGISDIPISTSIGIAVGTADDTAGELLRKADIAMYMAKRRGKNRYEVFRDEEQSENADKLLRIAELQRGLERGEFVAHYQPTIDLEEGRIVGVEALVRWQHPERGLLPPDEFVPLAEESGLIVAIGGWVLREACEQIGRWRLELGDVAPREVSVNLSAAQLARDDFVLEVADALDETAMSSGALTLEITESGLMSDLALTSRRLGALKRLGVNLAVDDFGTGYSSLAYLQQFPIDTLKIDRAFVAHVDGSAENAALAKAIVRLGHDLNLRTVAEGIERSSQVDALRRMRCPVGQGFYFSHPLRADQITALLRGGTMVPAP